MLSGSFANPATREYVTKIGERDFDTVGFAASGGLKDVELMIAAAQEVKLRLSSAEAVRTKLEASIGPGGRTRIGAASPTSTAVSQNSALPPT